MQKRIANNRNKTQTWRRRAEKKCYEYPVFHHVKNYIIITAHGLLFNCCCDGELALPWLRFVAHLALAPHC